MAALCGHLPVLKWMLTTHPAIGVNAETRGWWGARVTALQLAAANGHMNVVAWLIGQGADPLREYKEIGFEPVPLSFVAAKHGHAAVASYLREQEAVMRAEQEAATRRARNGKRRQKQKKAKARQSKQQERAAGCGEPGEGVEKEEGGRSEGGGAFLLAKDVADEQAADDDLLRVPSTEGAGDDAVAKEHLLAGKGEGKAKATAAGDADVAPSSPIPAGPLFAPPPPPPPVARPPPLQEYLETHAPDDCLCPISLGLLEDPVVLAGDGFTYSRAAIEQRLASHRTRESCRWPIDVSSRLAHTHTHEPIPSHNPTTPTGGMPLTSPKTGLEIDGPAEEGAVLVPNFLVRSFVAKYKATKTREWEAAERRWREWAAEGQGKEKA